MGGLAYEEIQSMESDSSERKDSFEIPSNLSQDQARYLEDLHRAFSQVDNLSDFLRQIDNRLKYFKHLTSYLIADNDKLNLEISVLNSEKQSSSTRFTAECEALINKSKVLEDELRNTREYYESSKTAFLDFKTSSEDKEKQLAHELKLIHEANSFLSEEKQALTSEKETLENRISTLETAMENCKIEMSFDTAQQHEIQLKMQQSEDRNIELERKLCQIEEKRLKLEAEIERLTIIEAEYHNCCLKIQELERFMRDTLVDHETAQKLIDSLTQDRQEVMDRLKKTVDELESIKLLFSKAQEVENELCEKIELLNKTYISLENERDLLKKENQELHQHTIELKDANKNYETEILNLQQNLIDGEIDFKKLNTSFEEKCLIIENQTQKLNEIETLYSSHEELQTTKTSLENQFEKISLELEASVRDRDNFKSQLEVYQTQCKELQNGADESVKNMSVELENSRTRVVELHTKINEIESHKNQQEENIIALEKSLENLIRETKDLKLLVQQLEEANSEKDNFNENLEQVLRGKTSEFEASLENMSKLQENNEKLENQVSVLSQELGRIQNLTENLEQESRKSEMELEAKNMENFCHVKKIKDLENILAAQTAELDSKNVQIENLNQSRKELELFKDNYDLIKNNLEQSSAFTEKLKEELEFLKSSNQTNVPELERTHYEKRSQDLQTQLEAKLDSQVSVTKKIEELSSDLNKVSSERDQLQSKYSELEAELVQLREEGSIRKEKSYFLGNESSEIATQSGNSDAAVVKENSELKSEIERNKTKMGKMLFKLKQFKEKNDKLTIKVNELSASVVPESTPAEKDEVNHLKMEIEDLKGKNIELANELEESKSFKERFNNLEVLCENLNREIQEVTELKASDQVEAKKENNKLKEELETLAEIKMQLESQARMSKNELDSYLSEKEQLSTEIAFLREQSDMLSNDNETYQSLIENLKQGKQNLEAELIRQKENYSKDTKQLENQVQRLTDSLRKIEIELNEKDNTILKLNFETKQQNENLQKITDDYNKLSIEKRQIEHEKRELGFKLEEASNNIERELLLQEMESLKEHYEQTLQQEKLRNNQRIEKEIFAQNVHHPRDNADLGSKDKINYLEVENSRLASEKEQLRADKSQMQIELESLEGKLKINNQQQRQLLQELNAAKLNLDSQNLIVRNMANENSESKLKKNELEQHCSLLHGEKNRFEKLYHDICKEKQILEDTMRIKGSNESQGHRNQQLEMELQQAMHTVHQQGIRCEELNMEISRIIEEKTNLQQQLLQNQKSINSRRESKPQEHFVNIEVESAFDEPFRNSKFSVETSQVFELQQRNSRLEETENARQELLSTNASLERDLAREKERRSLVEEELTSAQAWQERMGLNSSKDEYQLLLEEEPLMIPETDFSISRQVLTNAYRVKRWVVGRRNYFTRIIRRSSRIQLVLYFYLFLIHVWLLTCLL